jgi:hypothetical protein
LEDRGTLYSIARDYSADKIRSQYVLGFWFSTIFRFAMVVPGFYLVYAINCNSGYKTEQDSLPTPENKKNTNN